MMLLRLSKHVLYGCLFAWTGLIYGCAQISDGAGAGNRLQPAVMINADVSQKPAEKYAGEVLAYMVPVTLGKMGNPKLRKEWGARGLLLPLDYGVISSMMQGPEKDIRRVMVLDNNILGLSQVLYHYDERLNLFKGEGLSRSIFPSTELLSIRVMLLQKINRGEKVGLAELMKKKQQLLDPHISAEEIDLEGTGLHFIEMKLLKDVIRSEPPFLAYLENPFVVEMLYRVGAASMDSYVKKKIRLARYKTSDFKQDWKGFDNKTVQVAVLPSLVKSFSYQSIDMDAYPMGFMPEDSYLRAVETFQVTMLGFLQQLVLEQMFGGLAGKDAAEQERRNLLAREFIDMHLYVRILNQRPLVIYPDNADKVIQDICRDSDFNVIVLGKNVYLSMQIFDADTFPHVNRLYLDISDIRYGQADFEISQISLFVFNKLKPLI
jgi:hypothetical protein